MNRTLIVIAHLSHYFKDGLYYSYEPYVREIELWSDLFERVEIYTDFQKGFKSKVPLKPLPANCFIKDIGMRSGPGLTNNLIRLIQLPFVSLRLIRIIYGSELLHLRSPGITTVISNGINKFLNKKTIVKWSTQFDFIPPLTRTQRIELKYLKNPPANTKVLIYGEGSHPNHISFFPALMTRSELDRLKEMIRPRDWSGKKRLLCVGRLFGLKNFDSVIEGLGKFKSKYPEHDWEFVLIGDGQERLKIEELIRVFDLKKEVKLVGAKPFSETLDWYGKSHIAIMPGKYEGWPKVVSEAWATGCIPLVINCGNATYPYIYTGNQGFSYDPDPDSFADKLNEIFSMPAEELNRLQQKGVESNYSMTLEMFKEKIKLLIQSMYDTREIN